MRNLIVFLFLFALTFVFGQELNGRVTVDFSKISTSNQQVFKTLENALNDFINKTVWSDKTFKQNEKIKCSFLITVNGYDNNSQFETSIQVQSSRPIYNSNYASPVLNLNDKDFNFQYTEFENLVYSPNTFDSNLTAVFAFYCQVILGLDAETFSAGSGDSYFEVAQNIASLGGTSGSKGWAQTEKTQNRYFLINDLISPAFKLFKDRLFDYHFKGLDTMTVNAKNTKNEIVKAIDGIAKVFSVRPSAYLLRVFVDAKSDEIVSIFSDGPNVPVDELVNNLNKISPTNSAKWALIKP